MSDFVAILKPIFNFILPNVSTDYVRQNKRDLNRKYLAIISQLNLPMLTIHNLYINNIY